jgi:hypothetical protein
LRSLEVEPVLADETMWDRLGPRQPEFDPDLLRTNFLQFDEQFERFTLRRCDDLVASEKVKILLHETVLEIRAGRVFPTKLWRLLNLLPRTHRQDGLRYAALGRLSETLQERGGILNSSFTLSVRRHQGTRRPPGK